MLENEQMDLFSRNETGDEHALERLDVINCRYLSVEKMTCTDQSCSDKCTAYDKRKLFDKP